MEIRVFENATQVGAAGAALFAAQLLKKPDSVLGSGDGVPARSRRISI